MKKADLVPSGQRAETIRDIGVDLVPDLVPSGQPQDNKRFQSQSCSRSRTLRAIRDNKRFQSQSCTLKASSKRFWRRLYVNNENFLYFLTFSLIFAGLGWQDSTRRKGV